MEILGKKRVLEKNYIRKFFIINGLRLCVVFFSFEIRKEIRQLRVR